MSKYVKVNCTEATRISLQKTADKYQVQMGALIAYGAKVCASREHRTMIRALANEFPQRQPRV